MVAIPELADHFFSVQALLFQLIQIHAFLGIFFLILQQEILPQHGFQHYNYSPCLFFLPEMLTLTKYFNLKGFSAYTKSVPVLS